MSDDTVRARWHDVPEGDFVARADRFRDGLKMLHIDAVVVCLNPKTGDLFEMRVVEQLEPGVFRLTPIQ